MVKKYLQDLGFDGYYTAVLEDLHGNAAEVLVRNDKGKIDALTSFFPENLAVEISAFAGRGRWFGFFFAPEIESVEKMREQLKEVFPMLKIEKVLGKEKQVKISWFPLKKNQEDENSHLKFVLVKKDRDGMNIFSSFEKQLELPSHSMKYAGIKDKVITLHVTSL